MNEKKITSTSLEEIIIWDLDSGEVISKFEPPNTTNFATCFYGLSFEKFLFSTSNGTVKVIDGNNGRIVSEIDAHKQKIRSVGITNNWKYLVTASEDKSVKIWKININTGLIFLNFLYNQILTDIIIITNNNFNFKNKF
jgi:WD40 repeat protein